MDNRLDIHFSEDKTKSILFTSKHKIKVTQLNINYKEIQIKQHSKVTYFRCILDETMSGESMALKVINKINSKLKFLHRKNTFLTHCYGGYNVILLFNLTLIIHCHPKNEKQNSNHAK